VQRIRSLPGHGPAGGPEILTGQIDLLQDLYATVQEQAEQGTTLEQMQIALPERDKN
jgi:hypothetical protein